MKIYRASKTNRRTQGFGENLLPIYKQWGMKGHNGWDWACSYGEPIYWDCDIKGTVLNCHIDNSGGLGVDVISQDKDGDFKHRFWHLKEFKCKAGDILDSGDLIGLGDSTGYSTGNHLHRGLKPVYKNKNNNWKNTYQGNGYFGAIEIQPYFKSIYIKDYMNLLKAQVSILWRIIEIMKKLIKLKADN